MSLFLSLTNNQPRWSAGWDWLAVVDVWNAAVVGASLEMGGVWFGTVWSLLGVVGRGRQWDLNTGLRDTDGPTLGVAEVGSPRMCLRENSV
jgi:hypothetical protein